MKRLLPAFVFVALALYGVVAFAGGVKAAKKVVAPETETAVVASNAVTATDVKPHTVKKTAAYLEHVVGSVWYNYFWNSGGPRHLVWFKDGTGASRAYMIYITRTPASATGVREITYVSYDGTTFSAPAAAIAGTTQSTYFSGIDVWRGGAADGLAGIGAGWAGAGNSYYCLESAAGAGGFTTTQVTNNRDVQVTNVNDLGTVVLNHSKTRSDYAFRVSTDFGTTWADGHAGLVAAFATGGQGQGCLEPPIVSRNGNLYLFTDLLASADNQIPPVGTNVPDSASRFCIFKSTDAGTTWAKDDLGFPDGTQYNPNHYALFSNFDQLDLAVDASEKAHVIFNGYNFYQYAASVDSLRNSMDAVYWDKTNGFKSLVSFDRTLAILPEVIAKRGTPGVVNSNRMGCSYPSIATSDDGQKIVCTWSQPNFTASTIDTSIPGGWVTSNIWYNASFDGGATWKGAQKLTSATAREEEFGTLAENLEVAPSGDVTARVLFLRVAGEIGVDAAAGEAVYVEWTISATGVNDKVNAPVSFRLDQNYPNPFNPSTKISYTLPNASTVNLSVFNVLGQEVATLVNENQNAGEHFVNFNAANLSSGVYFYTLKTGNFTETKKMALMK